MTADLQDVFADTAFWIALVVKQDQYNERAVKWSTHVRGRIVTTAPVLLETAEPLAAVPQNDAARFVQAAILEEALLSPLPAGEGSGVRGARRPRRGSGAPDGRTRLVLWKRS